MNIKDYLHLYLGCNVKSSGKVGKLASLGIEGYSLIGHEDGDIYYYDHSVEAKPILRPLSDMTDEEMDEVWYGHEPKNVLVMEYKNSGMERKVALCSERTRYLLSRGFDLFFLIDAGLAIDASLKEENA